MLRLPLSLTAALHAHGSLVGAEADQLRALVGREGLARVCLPRPPAPTSPSTSPVPETEREDATLLIDSTFIPPVCVVALSHTPLATLRARLASLRPSRLLLAGAPPDLAAYRALDGASDGLPGLELDVWGRTGVLHLTSSHWVTELRGVWPAVRGALGLEALWLKTGRGTSARLIHGHSLSTVVQAEEQGRRYRVPLTQGGLAALPLSPPLVRARLRLASLVALLPHTLVPPHHSQHHHLAQLRGHHPPPPRPTLLVVPGRRWGWAHVASSSGALTLLADAGTDIEGEEGALSQARAHLKGDLGSHHVWAKAPSRALHALAQTRRYFDLVLLDLPPSPSASLDLRALVASAAALVVPGGRLLVVAPLGDLPHVEGGLADARVLLEVALEQRQAELKRQRLRFQGQSRRAQVKAGEVQDLVWDQAWAQFDLEPDADPPVPSPSEAPLLWVWRRAPSSLLAFFRPDAATRPFLLRTEGGLAVDPRRSFRVRGGQVGARKEEE